MSTVPSTPPPTITEVDGVSTIWSDLPGPVRAGLIFRMGSADETFVTSGTTHLLEHLALFGIGRPGEHSNGFVDQTVTVFHCTGDHEVVTGFLDSVTRQLADPLVGRLAEERDILRAEYAQKGASAEGLLLTWRYGCQTYGLAAGTGLGLHALTAEGLVAWSHRYATRGNCVLWMSSPPPRGLRLGLPDGGPMPAPDPRASVLPQLPAYVSGPGEPVVALHSVVERGYVNQALVHVLRSRLIDELRTRRAVAYSPQVDYRPISGDAGHLLAVSDLLPDRQSDGVRPFLAALQEMAAGGVSEQEVIQWREGALRDLEEPRADVSRLASYAWQVLFGDELASPDQVIEQLGAVHAEDVVARASAALSQALALVPRHVRISREPWVPAPFTVLEPVPGREYRHLEAPEGNERIIVGDEGITIRDGDRHATVTKRSAVGVQSWPDGRRSVTGSDGTTVNVEPTLWTDGPEIVAAIDHLWGPDLVLSMPPRPVADIPTPRPPAPAGPTTAPAAPTTSAAAPTPGQSAPNTLIFLVLAIFAVVVFVASAVLHRSPAPLLPALVIGFLAARSGARRKSR